MSSLTFLTRRWRCEAGGHSGFAYPRDRRNQLPKGERQRREPFAEPGSAGRERRAVRGVTYRWVDHTAEVELHVEAARLEEVFADALAAFAELVGDSARGAPARHEVEVTAQDLPTLLADWLGELVFLAETEGLVPERASTLELAGTTLRATVEGRRGEPSPIVKAVTYHGLELREDDGVWKARVVLDV